MCKLPTCSCVFVLDYLIEVSALRIHILQASIPCSAPAADKGYMVKESIIPSNGKKRLELPVQKNILTNYFCILSMHLNFIQENFG